MFNSKEHFSRSHKQFYLLCLLLSSPKQSGDSAGQALLPSSCCPSLDSLTHSGPVTSFIPTPQPHPCAPAFLTCACVLVVFLVTKGNPSGRVDASGRSEG